MSTGFGTAISNEVFVNGSWISDGIVYASIKGLDSKTSMKFKEGGGYVLMGLLGRALVEYADTTDNLSTTVQDGWIDPFKCQLKPLVSAVLAATGAAFTGAYGGSPFSIFKEGVVIYLVSDAIIMKVSAMAAKTMGSAPPTRPSGPALGVNAK